MAKVHNFTTERARRGRLPFSWTIDVGKGTFCIRMRADATLTDLIAMADAAESWAKSLRVAAKALRSHAGKRGGRR